MDVVEPPNVRKIVMLQYYTHFYDARVMKKKGILEREVVLMNRGQTKTQPKLLHRDIVINAKTRGPRASCLIITTIIKRRGEREFSRQSDLNQLTFNLDFSRLTSRVTHQHPYSQDREKN